MKGGWVIKMAFEEVENEVWRPDKDGDTLTGVLLSKEENVGENDSMLYTLEVNNKPIIIWGSTVLDGKMVSVKVGEMVKIEYSGRAEARPGKKPAKLFKVYVDRNNQPNEITK